MTKLDEELGKITPELIDEFGHALKGYAASAGAEGFAINAACLMLETIADKLRTGQLVPAQPSGDVVEAVASLVTAATAVRNACLGTPVGGGDGGTYVPGHPTMAELNNLTAAIKAITTYEAVSGVAKMRESLTLAIDLICGTHEYEPTHPVVAKIIAALGEKP